MTARSPARIDPALRRALRDDGPSLVRAALDGSDPLRPDEDALFALGVAIGLVDPALVDDATTWALAAPRQRRSVVRWLLRGALEVAPASARGRVEAAVNRIGSGDV